MSYLRRCNRVAGHGLCCHYVDVTRHSGCQKRRSFEFWVSSISVRYFHFFEKSVWRTNRLLWARRFDIIAFYHLYCNFFVILLEFFLILFTAHSARINCNRKKTRTENNRTKIQTDTSRGRDRPRAFESIDCLVLLSHFSTTLLN